MLYLFYKIIERRNIKNDARVNVLAHYQYADVFWETMKMKWGTKRKPVIINTTNAVDTWQKWCGNNNIICDFFKRLSGIVTKSTEV